MGTHPNKTKATGQEHQEGGWGAGERERKHTPSLSLISDKQRTFLADETHPLRPEFSLSRSLPLSLTHTQARARARADARTHRQTDTDRQTQTDRHRQSDREFELDNFREKESESERENKKMYLFLGLSLFHKEHGHTAYLGCAIHF